MLGPFIRIIEIVIALGIWLLFIIVLPDHLSDEVNEVNQGWKTLKYYYLLPAILCASIVIRTLYCFFVKSFFLEAIGRVGDKETGDKDAKIIYDVDGEQYASVYRKSKKLKPDWTIKVHVHPTNHNRAVFDLERHTRITVVSHMILIAALLFITYTTTTPLMTNS